MKWELTRIDTPELLDAGVGTPLDAEINLAEVWRMNRYLGGARAITQHLFPRLKPHQSLVDIGAGSGELLSYITECAGMPLRLYALDLIHRHLLIAHRKAHPQIKLIQSNALSLPFREGSIDYFISSLLIHHLLPEQVIMLLRSASERARCGIIMSDVIRGRLPLIAFNCIQPVFARHYVTRYDGKASIKRAYTPSELQAFAREAGLHHARIYTHFPWRMTLVADK